MIFLANSPKTVFFFFTPVRLRVETSLSPSRSLFSRENRCSEETVVDWQCPSFGSSLPISCSSLLFFSEDSNVSVLQEVMLTPADLVTVVAIKRSVFGIRGAGPTPLTALGILFAVLRHSGAEMALCRWLLSLLCSSFWTADI